MRWRLGAWRACFVVAAFLLGCRLADAQSVSCPAATESLPADVTRLVETTWKFQQPATADALSSLATKLAAALAAHPQSAPVLVADARVLWALRDARGAVDAINRALGAEPCYARAHFMAWLVEDAAGQADKAWQQLAQAHDLAPADGGITRTWQAVGYARTLQAAPGAGVIAKLPASVKGEFFRKTVLCGEVPVRSSGEVSDEALVLACAKVRAVLANLPDAAHRLAKAGGELHILGEREGTSLLPENRHFATEPYVDAEGKSTSMDQRTRGVGGLQSSCGEENLLHEPGDRYAGGYDTCTHEFAHAVRNFGLTGKQKDLTEQQYRAAMARKLWPGAYAAVNADEYWSELTQWYFGGRGSYAPGSLRTPGPEALRAYDPEGYALCLKLYGPPPSATPGLLPEAGAGDGK